MEELEARISALEAQVRVIREDAAAARVLAGGADRDVSAFAARLDAHKALLEALRETQVEQGQRIGGLEQRFGGLEQRFDALEREMRGGFATVSVGQSEILTLLRRLDDQDGDQEDPGP